MKTPQPYQSQIQKTEVGYEIITDSPLKRFVSRLPFVPLVICHIALLPFFFAISWILMMLFVTTFVALILVYFLRDELTSSIMMNNERIQQSDKIIFLRNIPYLDVYIKIEKEVVLVEMGKIVFQLNETSDLPKLTDAISEITDLEFYGNRQFKDKTEVLTFKSKSIAIPTFPSFLTIKKTKTTLQVYDMLDQFNMLEFNLQDPTTVRHYVNEKQSNILRTFQLIDTEKLRIVVDNRGTFTGQGGRVSIIAVESLAKIRKTYSDSIINFFEKYITSLNHKTLFHSSPRLKETEDNLTNLRDGEKLYELLSNLSTLGNIEVELVIKA